MIAVFVNPHSRANRRNPKLAARLDRVLGDAGRVIVARSLDLLEVEARTLAAAPPHIIAVHGGDGTLHKTLSALIPAWGERSLPPIAILGGGTMNVVANSLGIRAQAIPFLVRLVKQTRGGALPEVIHRRCLRVGDQFGFVFGNGVLANFLDEYYGGRRYGPLRALELLTRFFFSSLLGGAFARRLGRRFKGRVLIDGETLNFLDFAAIGAGTVREIGLGFKLLHQADDDPERFAVLAIHADALALVPDLWAVRTGRGIHPSRASSVLGSRLDIEPTEANTPYTIDGDLYRVQERLHIALGPRIPIVDPRRLRA